MDGTSVTISKPKYRSELGIVLEILDLLASRGRQGIIVSAIARIANVSYNSVNEICQKLVDGELVILFKDKNKCRYIITEKGIAFLTELRQFANLIQSLNIRC